MSKLDREFRKMVAAVDIEYILERLAGGEWVHRGDYTYSALALDAMRRETDLTGLPHRIVRREVLASTETHANGWS